MKRILLTTDFSDASKRAFSTAAEVAKCMAGGITLVHVVIDLQTAPQGAPLAPPLSSPGISDEIAEARRRIAEFAKEVGGGLDLKTEVLTGSSVAETLAEYARKQGAAMIVIATHGRTGWRHLILGSVTEEVVRHARVPVLTVPVQP